MKRSLIFGIIGILVSTSCIIYSKQLLQKCIFGIYGLFYIYLSMLSLHWVFSGLRLDYIDYIIFLFISVLNILIVANRITVKNLMNSYRISGIVAVVIFTLGECAIVFSGFNGYDIFFIGRLLQLITIMYAIVVIPMNFYKKSDTAFSCMLLLYFIYWIYDLFRFAEINVIFD